MQYDPLASEPGNTTRTYSLMQDIKRNAMVERLLQYGSSSYRASSVIPWQWSGKLQEKFEAPSQRRALRLKSHYLRLNDLIMLSGILIFNQKGENLIFRAFRNDCRPRLADVFRIQVISNAQVRSPILTLGSTTFSHVKHENIYLVAVTKSNANAALVFEFLYRLVGLGRGYFGKFDEEAVKNNFVLVYELLDGARSLAFLSCCGNDLC